MAHRMRQLPVLEVSSTDAGSLENEELVTTHNLRKQLKSGKLSTTDSLIVHCVTWPDDPGYTTKGQPPMYDTIFMPLFISSYMQVMEAEKPAVRPLMATHMVELMCDAELYGWEHVRIFHAVLLQQLEHSCIMWVDEDVRLKFQRALVWHQPAATHKALAAPASAKKKQTREKLPFSISAKPGKKACSAYN